MVENVSVNAAATLERLDASAIADVMRIESIPAYAGLIGTFSHAKHEAEMASSDSRYLGYRAGADLAGFAILQEFRQPVIRLRRIAVAAPGEGVGTTFLRALMDWVFETTPAAGLRLHVRAENARARSVYLREGFGDNSSDATGYRMSIARERWLRLRADGGIARPAD